METDMLDLSLSLWRPGRVGRGSPYDPDAVALFERFTTPPTSGRKAAINKVIVALKAASAWERLDVLYIRAAADSQAGRLNWKGDFFNSTAVSSPAFAADRGFTPDGAASYLSSGFSPTVATDALFAQDDAHVGAWHLTDLSNGGSTSYDLGNGNSRISNSASANTALRGNMDTTITLSGDDYTKHKVWTRDGATSWRYFNDGALVGGDPRTDASVALTNFEFGTGKVLSNGFGVNTEAISHWGASLTTAQVLAMRDAFSEYLQAVGAI